MKYDFTFYNPTKIYFGKTAFKNLKTELKNYGPNFYLCMEKVQLKEVAFMTRLWMY